jgi:DNA-binding transcriptional MerR regulator
MKKNTSPDRIYFSIGEVASMFQVNTSLIRFWEKEFDIIQPHKSKKGNRLFTAKDIDNFHLIYHLVKERGYTLNGAREKLKQNPADMENNLQVYKTLENAKQFLLGIKKHL